MSVLTGTPFSNTLGSIVKATVEARNVVGYSTPSTVNTVGADVRTVPLSPPNGPTRNDAGTTST